MKTRATEAVMKTRATEAMMKTRAAEAWIEDLKNTLLAKREC